MRPRHIGTHFVDEAMVRWSRGWAFSFAIRRAVRGFLRACRAVLDTQDYVEELDQGGLSVATTAVLNVGVIIASACIELDAIGQSSICHILAASQERPDAVVEDVRIAVLIHSLEQCA